jgi:hypothetical protein
MGFTMFLFARPLLSLFVAVAAVAMPAAAVAAPPPPAPEPFFRHPDHADFKLSPTGK